MSHLYSRSCPSKNKKVFTNDFITIDYLVVSDRGLSGSVTLKRFYVSFLYEHRNPWELCHVITQWYFERSSEKNFGLLLLILCWTIIVYLVYRVFLFPLVRHFVWFLSYSCFFLIYPIKKISSIFMSTILFLIQLMDCFHIYTYVITVIVKIYKCKTKMFKLKLRMIVSNGFQTPWPSYCKFF